MAEIFKIPISAALRSILFTPVAHTTISFRAVDFAMVMESIFTLLVIMILESAMFDKISCSFVV